MHFEEPCQAPLGIDPLTPLKLTPPLGRVGALSTLPLSWAGGWLGGSSYGPRFSLLLQAVAVSLNV